MHQRPFPKPPPAEPLPEEVWLEQTDRAEVGREAFFYGRDTEYDIFRKAVESLREGQVGGGTMIFQGAPGIGKTALMQECMEAVRCHSTPDDPWVAVSIIPEILQSAVQTIRIIVQAANTESERLSKTAPSTIAAKLQEYQELGRKLYQELSQRGVGAAGFSVGGKPLAADMLDSNLLAQSAFIDCAPLLEKFNIVVFVDEAQNTPTGDATEDVLDCLHRDPQGIPLVAAFFGLSDTEQVLRQCGLSRYAAKRVVNLNPLETRVAAGSFRRMFDAYYTGAEEEKDLWADALADLSQGWPQHINRVGVAAGEVLRTNEGQLERRFLNQALEKGAERKNDYYAGRLKAGSQDPVLYKQIAVAAAHKPKGILSRKDLRRLARSDLEETEESFDDFLTYALHAGLLAPVADLGSHYQFPIPSLSDYLRSLPVDLPSSVQ